MGGHKERVKPYTAPKSQRPESQQGPRRLSKGVRDQLMYLGVRSLAEAKPLIEGIPTTPSTS